MGKSYLNVAFALLFLLSEIAQLCFCSNCIESEKQALLKFKSTITSDQYNILSSWNATNDNCCQWYGIGCHHVTGHVIKLNLTGFHYLEAAGVDPSLMQLEHLSYLDLSFINFGATPIPFFFASMKRLRYLSLSNANFSGKLPYNLGNLTKLHHLDLRGNDLVINDMNWAAELQSLQHLDMGHVYLGEAHNLFQVLFVLPSLLRLYLDGCRFPNFTTHPHPIHFTNFSKFQVLDLSSNGIDSLPLWFDKFHYLVDLDLSGNALHGPIPDVLRNMTSLEDLDLSANNLSSVPSWLVELKTLRFLGLAFNRLTKMECSLSSILGNMCHLKILDFSYNYNLQGFGDKELPGCNKYDIEELNLRHNQVNDRLPNWLGYLGNLNYLNLGENLFYGPIPFSIGKLSRLESLYLEDNHLNGSIPDSIEKLVNLEYLDLSNNNLDGFLPNNLGQLVNLKSLYLSNNSFNGTIPQSLGQLVNLESIDLSINSFSGTIPNSFGQLVNLRDLDLSSNHLEGIISKRKHWSSIMKLSSLILSNNQISGSLPKNIGDIMPELGILTLENNYINGSIPNSLCKIESLFSLDLSKNKLFGEIPNCWKDYRSLTEINLSFNRLSGHFPSSFGNLSSLFSLHLNNNNLQGELPLMSLKNLTQLVLLDLGENQLSSIPSWTENIFPRLQIFRLRQNMLTGSIPPQLCQLTSLQILDLANNNLTGSIPHCIGNLTGMISEHNETSENLMWQYQDVKQVMKGTESDYVQILFFVVNMDLSNNKLVGLIPKGITQLIGLHGLNLSNNYLKGQIPKMIGDMKSLESFDISGNQLSGTIPNSMSALTSLSHLNISYNNLSGPIPRENQFLTLDDPSIYTGNPYLCGPPLPNKCFDNSSHQVPESKDSEDENDTEKVWFYFVVAVGFATGFWAAIGTLVLKKRWRHACFRRVEDVADEIYVTIVIKVARLKRMLRSPIDG